MRNCCRLTNHNRRWGSIGSQRLTVAERERAVYIARNNRTVRSRVTEMDRVEFSVDPIYRLDTGRLIYPT